MMCIMRKAWRSVSWAMRISSDAGKGRLCVGMRWRGCCALAEPLGWVGGAGTVESPQRGAPECGQPRGARGPQLGGRGQMCGWKVDPYGSDAYVNAAARRLL